MTSLQQQQQQQQQQNNNKTKTKQNTTTMDNNKYKNTEMKNIPEGWEWKTLGEIGSFTKGSGISRIESNSGNIPAIRYGEIYTSHNNYIKQFYSFISEEVARNSYKLKKGDILFTASGETKEEIGKSVAFVSDIEAYAGGDIIILSPNQPDIDSMFLGYLSNSRFVQKQKSSKGQGDAVVHISTDSIKNLQIPLPPLPEQRRIAAILSDMDAHLAALDALIAKKQAIKKGTMQQLLTGKKRLQGFVGEWKECRLGDCAEMNSGGTPSTNDKSNYGGNIPFLSITDISIAGKYINNTEKRITEKGLNSSSARMFGAGTIMYAMYASVGKCAIANIDLATSQAILGIIPDETINNEYLYYLLTFLQNKVLSFGQTGTQTNLSKKLVGNFVLSLPASLPEQRAISAILSDMDKEILALQAKRSKYEALKHGAMQELINVECRM